METIDKQHKHLIGLANKLLQAVNHHAYDEVKTTLHDFREYTVYHFADEEQYLESIRYPKLAEQTEQHAILKKKVKYFQEVMYRQGTIPQEEILEFLRDWLLGHIIKYDLEIKKFVDSPTPSEPDSPRTP